MDPDTVFLILSMIVLIGVALSGIIGLSVKISKSKLPDSWKVFLYLAMPLFLVTSTVSMAGMVGINQFVFIALMYINVVPFGLYWSLRITKSRFIERIKIPQPAKILIVALIITIATPYLFIGAGFLVYNLDLLGGN